MKIAFIGYNERLTRQFFLDFARNNSDQIAAANLKLGRIILIDGTEIFRISAGFIKDGYRFDQVIVADDRRKNVFTNRNCEVAAIDACMAFSRVPQDFRTIFYDTDAVD